MIREIIQLGDSRLLEKSRAFKPSDVEIWEDLDDSLNVCIEKFQYKQLKERLENI